MLPQFTQAFRLCFSLSHFLWTLSSIFSTFFPVCRIEPGQLLPDLRDHVFPPVQQAYNLLHNVFRKFIRREPCSACRAFLAAPNVSVNPFPGGDRVRVASAIDTFHSLFPSFYSEGSVCSPVCTYRLGSHFPICSLHCWQAQPIKSVSTIGRNSRLCPPHSSQVPCFTGGGLLTIMAVTPNSAGC